MRVFLSVFIVSFLAATFAWADDDIGASVNTDDICSARPDLCGTSHKRTKRKRVRTVKKKKKTEAQAVEEDAFNDFFSSEMNEAEQPKRQVRKPSSLEAVRRRVSFSDYMNANSANPALNTRRSIYQDAFPNIVRTAVFSTSPEPEATTPSSTSAAPAAAPGAASENKPAAAPSSDKVVSGAAGN